MLTCEGVSKQMHVGSMDITTAFPAFARSIPMISMKVAKVALPKAFNVTLLVDVTSVSEVISHFDFGNNFAVNYYNIN